MNREKVQKVDVRRIKQQEEFKHTWAQKHTYIYIIHLPLYHVTMGFTY